MPNFGNTRAGWLLGLTTALAVGSGCSQKDPHTSESGTDHDASGPNTTELVSRTSPASENNPLLSTTNFSTPAAAQATQSFSYNLAGDPSTNLDASTNVHIAMATGTTDMSGESSIQLPNVRMLEEGRSIGVDPIRYFVDTFPVALKGASKIEYNIPENCTHVLVNIRSFTPSSYVQIPDEALAIAQKEALEAVADLEALYDFKIYGIEGTSVSELNELRARYADPLGLQSWAQTALDENADPEAREAAENTVQGNLEAQGLLRADIVSAALRSSALTYLFLKHQVSLAVVEAPSHVGQANQMLRQARELITTKDPGSRAFALGMSLYPQADNVEEGQLITRLANAFQGQAPAGSAGTGVLPMILDARHDLTDNLQPYNAAAGAGKPKIGTITVTLEVVGVVDEWTRSTGDDVARISNPELRLASMRKGILGALRGHGYDLRPFEPPTMDSFTRVFTERAKPHEDPPETNAEPELVAEVNQTDAVTAAAEPAPQHNGRYALATVVLAGLTIGGIALRARARRNS